MRKFQSRTSLKLRAPRHVTGLAGSQGLVGHYNGNALGVKGKSHAACVKAWQSIQRFHMDSHGWSDIAYNFGICHHGFILEGRGWGRRSAANGTNAGNSWGHAVMFLIGGKEGLTRRARWAFRRLRKEHRRRFGKAAIRPHHSFKATACPGPKVSRWFKAGAPRPPRRVPDPHCKTCTCFK